MKDRQMENRKMMDRRTLFTATAATALTAASGVKAAGTGAPVMDDFHNFDVEDRGSIGIFERTPSLALETELDFYFGYRRWMGDRLRRASMERAVKVLRENGIDPRADAPLQDVVDMFTADPTIAMYNHNWERTQEAMWHAIKDEHDKEADRYLEELAQAEKRGPGTLELRKDLYTPEYARYEIHIQPGGYVGDRFAGYIYYHRLHTASFQKRVLNRLVRAVPIPEDGNVKRILDQGCGIGAYTQALKTRFPEAEVWGNDVAGPMLRFAHMKAVELDMDINYTHELSEQSHFPDEHFDIVMNNLVVHEVPAVQVKEIAADAYRTLRPGGVYYPIDSYSGDQPRNSAMAKYYAWRNYRWNHEVWWMEYYQLDMAEAMRDVGFKVYEDGPATRPDTTRNLMGIKV
jgi:ubiquinone/menaquinone biosynthesis C-methylase UbiE